MANSHDPIHETWLTSERLVPHRFIRPVIEFTRVEAAGGIVLLVAATIAIIWANSPWSEAYFDLFNAHIGFSFGAIHLDESLKHFINDGLMVVFFFVVVLFLAEALIKGSNFDDDFPKKIQSCQT